MKILFFLFHLGVNLHQAAAVKHSLKFFVTVSSGLKTFPDFVVVALIDEVPMGYCDSIIKRAEFKQDWSKKLVEDDPQHLEWYNQRCLETEKIHKYEFVYLKQQLNQTEDLPSVSLLQKTPSSPVSCHATGFYPNRAMMFWRKDGEELHDGVEPGEILPNHDGSFQLRVDLNLSSVKPEDWRKYECVFHLSGVKNDIVTKLDKTVIRTNRASDPTSFETVPVKDDHRVTTCGGK
ncbi:hypothetical protein PAMP_008442 [Pampus punctatissimus]